MKPIQILQDRRQMSCEGRCLTLYEGRPRSSRKQTNSCRTCTLKWPLASIWVEWPPAPTTRWNKSSFVSTFFCLGKLLTILADISGFLLFPTTSEVWRPSHEVRRLSGDAPRPWDTLGVILGRRMFCTHESKSFFLNPPLFQKCFFLSDVLEIQRGLQLCRWVQQSVISLHREITWKKDRYFRDYLWFFFVDYEILNGLNVCEIVWEKNFQL